MSLNSLFNKFKTKIAQKYGEDMGKMLIHTGVIGWFFSSLAQIGAIIINDKIPKEQKMFLIPQEMADAAVNIASFYIITNSFKSLAGQLVKTGKWVPESVRKFLTSNPELNAKVGKIGLDLSKSNLPKAIAKDYKSFEDGVDVVATTIGSVISCNLVTPLIRNRFASDSQKNSIARMNAKKQDKLAAGYLPRPTMTSFSSNAYSRISDSLKV